MPLVGMSVAAAVEIGTLVESKTDAVSVERSIRAASSIDAVSGAFEQEITPAFTAAVNHDPSLLHAPSRRPPHSKKVRTVPVSVTRARTDAAVAQLRVPPALRVRLTAQLAATRSGIDQATDLTRAYHDVSRLLTVFARAERAEVARARQAGPDPAGQRALTDVELAARASQTAAAETGSYVPTQFATASTAARLRATATQSWSNAVSAADDLTDGASPDVAAAWRSATRLPVVRRFNRFLATQIRAGTPFIGFEIVDRLVVPDGERNRAFAGVLNLALRSVLSAGREQRHRAELLLEIIAAVVLGLVALSVAISARIARTITRPLGNLASQATRISEGHLIDVDVGGPTEVRTVAAALSASVSSLRDIGAYATAVVAGRFDSDSVAPELPGPLGEVVQSSLARITTAVDEQKAAELALAHRATHDALTELPNRAHATVHLEGVLDTAARTHSDTALMFVDLDRFKSVNDTYGYAMGSTVIQRAAARLRDLVGENDVVARLGGDEFVVVIEDVADEAAVVATAQRIVTDLSRPMTIGGRQVRIGASVGLSFCRGGSAEAGQFLQEADAAMHRAKRGGRGRVAIFDDDLRRELAHRHELEAAIGAGLRRGEFDLHYQPVVDLKTGTTTEVEALIRWNRPGRGPVRPDDFIPVAEQSALIVEIGRWVLRRAARQLASWRDGDRSYAALSVAVNISGAHLTNPSLVDDVTSALDAAGVDASHLILEITETVLVDDDMVATQHMRTLREMGARISLDDFGTGFTSIGRLPTLPVDILKIDRSFVASEDTDRTSLVELMVGAAHAFGLTVIAEGIENDEQADRMRHAGVELGQGYLFAQPKPVDRLDVRAQSVARPAR